MIFLNAEKTVKELTMFIQDSCRKETCGKVLVAVSGWIDSATSLFLATRALGSKNVYPVLLPYGDLPTEGVRDAWLVIDSLKIPHNQVQIVNIKQSVDAVVKYDGEMDEARKGNIMARMRMMILYDLSKKLNYLVVGTENKSEHLLGYYTRFGDAASDIEPLRELYKTQVLKLAKFLGVPKKILTKPPTAGLWKGQTDEGEFGFPYKTADEVLYLHFEKKLSKEEIIAKEYDTALIEKIWWWIGKGKFKDRLPYTP